MRKRRHPAGYYDSYPRRDVTTFAVLKTKARKVWKKDVGLIEAPSEKTVRYELACGHGVTLIVTGEPERQALPCVVCGPKAQG